MIINKLRMENELAVQIKKVLENPKRINREQFDSFDSNARKEALKIAFEVSFAHNGFSMDGKFLCILAEHEDKNPSMVYNVEKRAFHCFGCMEHGQNLDLFDILMRFHNLQYFKQAFDMAESIFVMPKANLHKGKELYTKPPFCHWFGPMVKAWHNPNHSIAAEIPEAVQYMASRGISIETMIEHGVQVWEYSGAWYLVFINSNGSLVRRKFMDLQNDNMYANRPAKWFNQRGAGKSGYFNAQILKNCGDIVFLVESCIDCMTLTELGFKSVAINSVNNLKAFLNENHYDYYVGLFDNDVAGHTANKLLSDMGGLSVDYKEMPIMSQFKDINEALVKYVDRKALKEELDQLRQKAIDYYKLRDFLR